MKTKIILLAFLCFYIQSFAQLNNNSLVIGGNFSFQKQFPKNGGLTLLRINPEIGLVYKNKWESGLQLNYYYYKYDGMEPNYNRVYGAGVYTKRYFLLHEKLFFMLRGGFTTSFQKSSYANSNNTSYSLTIAPNFIYFPKKNLSINFGIGMLDYEIRNSSSEISISSSTITGGVSYFITPKSKKTTKN